MSEFILGLDRAELAGFEPVIKDGLMMMDLTVRIAE